MSAISSLRTLVLNADMQPLSWVPLSVWSWQEAFVAVTQGRVIQVKAYEDVFVHSTKRAFEIPSVVALKDYHKRKKVAFTRFNLFMRDQFQCQYCGRQLQTRELTFDHVVPRSKGGKSTWTNIVACCPSDNLRKGNKTLARSGLTLLRPPFEPTPFELDAAARRAPSLQSDLHRTWLDYLYWDSVLEAS